MENIKIFREQKGLSQKELAKCLGISKSYLNQLEHGKRLPSTELLIKICKFFKAHPCFFLCTKFDYSFPCCQNCFMKNKTSSYDAIKELNLIRFGKHKLKVTISLEEIK